MLPMQGPSATGLSGQGAGGPLGGAPDFQQLLGMNGPAAQRRESHEERFASEKHTSEIQKNEDLFESYQSSQSTWTKQASEDAEFYSGVHWTEEQVEELLERAQMPMSINTTYQVVEQAVGMLTHERPSFRAVGREDSDRRTGQVVSDVLQYIWQNSRGQSRVKPAVRDYYVKGRGVMMAFPDMDGDMGRGEVQITDLDPQQVFPDPNSTDPLWDDAAHILVKRQFTKEHVGQNWPDVDLTNVKSEEVHTHGSTGAVATHDQQIFQSDISDGYHEMYEVIERFTKVKKTFVRVRMPDLGTLADGDEEVMPMAAWKERAQDPAYIIQQSGERRPITQEERVREIIAIEKQFGPVFHYARTEPQVGPDGQLRQGKPVKVPGPAEENPNGIPGSTVRLMQATIGQLAEAGWIEKTEFREDRIKVTATIGDKMLYEPRVLPTRHYPVVPINNNHMRTPYPVSDVRMVKDCQKAINKTNSLILAHAANSTNMKVFLPRDSTNKEEVERGFGKAGTSVHEYDPISMQQTGSNPIETVGPPPLPSALYENMNRFVQIMQQTLGIFQMQQGDSSQAPDTYHGTLSLDEFGQRRIKSKMQDIYNSLSRLGEVAFDFVQEVYTEAKTLRLVQPNMPPKQVRVNEPRFDDFQNEVGRINDITTGRYDVMIKAGSTLPSNRWARLQQLIDMYSAGLVDDQAVLMESELPNAEQILARKGQMQQMQGALQEQKSTIEDLQGDLQTWMREAQHAKQKAELEKFKARLDTVHQDMAKAQQIYEQSLEQEKDKQEALMKERTKQASQNLQSGS